MNALSAVWRLPSAAAFLEDLELRLEQGLVLLPHDPAMPSTLELAVRRRLERRSWIVENASIRIGEPPARAIAEPLGAAPSLEGLLSGALAENVIVIDASSAIQPAHLAEWRTFLIRFVQARKKKPIGLALLVVDAPSEWMNDTELPVLRWDGRLRRLDVTLWADIHAPPERPEPLATLASALAVELCVWRLDLAAAIAQATKEDLLNPSGWLRRRDELPIPGARKFGQTIVECPLSLLSSGKSGEIGIRVWRAHLAAFFPWLEEQRLQLVKQYRTKLKIDDYLRNLGAKDPEDIELGSIAFQLRGRIPSREARLVQALARVRNDLAHRRPAALEDLDEALRLAA